MYEKFKVKKSKFKLIDNLFMMLFWKIMIIFISFLAFSQLLYQILDSVLAVSMHYTLIICVPLRIFSFQSKVNKKLLYLYVAKYPFS